MKQDPQKPLSIGFLMLRPNGGLLEGLLGKTPLLGKLLTCEIQMILTLDVCVCVRAEVW